MGAFGFRISGFGLLSDFGFRISDFTSPVSILSHLGQLLMLQLLASTLRVSTPLIFAALGGMFSERAGVINIALEGLMLLGALGAAVGTLATHSPWLGAACGMAAAGAAGGGLCAVRHSLARQPDCRRHRYQYARAGPDAVSVQNPLRRDGFDADDSVGRTIPIGAALPELGAGGALLVWVEVHAGGPLGQFRRRASRGVGRRRHPGQPRPLGGGFDERRAGGIGGGLAFGFPLVFVLEEHDGRARVHGAGGAHLRQMETGAGSAGLPVVRLRRSRADSFAGRGVLGRRAAPACNSFRFLPYVVTILVLAGFVGRSRPPKALGTAFRRD